MSKTSKSRLTGSGKKRRDAATVAVVDCVDGFGECQRRLAALAGLMVSCHEAKEAGQVRELGVLICEVACRLEELTDTLERTLREL